MLIACPACGEHAEADIFTRSGYLVKFCGHDDCSIAIKKMKHIPQNMLLCYNCQRPATRVTDDDDTPICEFVACELAAFAANEYHQERGS